MWLYGDAHENQVLDSAMYGDTFSFTPLIITGDDNIVRGGYYDNPSGQAIRVIDWGGFTPANNVIEGTLRWH